MNRACSALFAACMMAGSLHPVAAMNGLAVVNIQRQTGYDWENQRKCNLVIETIANNAITATDTILQTGFGGGICSPKFSFDGQKIAFARNTPQGVAVSLIDINGSNLRDIAYFDGVGSIYHMTREWVHVVWPKGDWVYYCYGGNGVEDGSVANIWRVNINDTTSKYLAARYDADVSRFTLSANGLYGAADVYRGVSHFSNGPRLYRFPSLNPDATLFADHPNLTSVLASNYCNSAISASGTIFMHFSGAHNKIDFAFWNHQTDAAQDYVSVLGPSSPCTSPNGPGGVCYIEIDDWLGLNDLNAPDNHNLFDYNTPCSNSDRWVLTQVWWGGAHNDGASFGIAVGWKDRAAIDLTKVPYSEYYDVANGKTFWTTPNQFGDLWVDGGPAAAGKMQDTTGAWVDVDPVSTLVDFHAVPVGQSNELTMVCSPNNASIYFTIDGSDPTTSSTRYGGPVSYTPGSNVITIKAKAFSTGMPTCPTVTKTISTNADGLRSSRITPSVDTLRFTATAGGANPSNQSVALTLGNDAPANPQLAASENATWLTTTLQSLNVQNAVNISGLASGIYTTLVTVNAPTMLSATYVVILRLDGPPVATFIDVTPPSALVAPGATKQFSAALRDQFGVAMTGSVTWSVSGGGSVSTSGLFTAPGTAGTSMVYATIGAAKDSSMVSVAAGCVLPTGFFKDLLCLEDGSGTPYLNTADATGIEAAYTGTGAAAPTEGVQITVNGRVYTWHLRTSSSGVWASDASRNGFCAYWFVTVASPIERQAIVSARHDDGVWVWNNGSLVGSLGGYTPGSDEAQTDSFTLNSGGNRMLFKLLEGSGDNYFAARLVNGSEQDISGLSYSPCTETTGVDKPIRASTSALSTKTRIAATSSGVRISVPANGAHSVMILDVRGKLVRSMNGVGAREYTVGSQILAAGMYYVKIRAGSRVETTRIVVR